MQVQVLFPALLQRTDLRQIDVSPFFASTDFGVILGPRLTQQSVLLLKLHRAERVLQTFSIDLVKMGPCFTQTDQFGPDQSSLRPNPTDGFDEGLRLPAEVPPEGGTTNGRSSTLQLSYPYRRASQLFKLGTGAWRSTGILPVFFGHGRDARAT